MTPPPDAVVVTFDPHIVWALAAITIALVVLALLTAAMNGEKK